MDGGACAAIIGPAGPANANPQPAWRTAATLRQRVDASFEPVLARDPRDLPRGSWSRLLSLLLVVALVGGSLFVSSRTKGPPHPAPAAVHGFPAAAGPAMAPATQTLRRLLAALRKPSAAGGGAEGPPTRVSLADLKAALASLAAPSQTSPAGVPADAASQVAPTSRPLAADASSYTSYETAMGHR